MPVFKEPARVTLEIVPSFERLHASDHGLQIDQGTIAEGTAQRGVRNLRVPRDGFDRIRRGPRPLRGAGASSLTQATGATVWPPYPSRNPMHFAVALSPFSSVEVFVRSNRHHKIVTACDLP